MYKEQAHRDPDDPADDHRGDCWDHLAIDPESRLVLAVVPGARDVEVVGETKRRTGGRILDLATGDEYPAYRTALLNAYGEEVTTTATGRRVRKMVPEKVPPLGMNHATVEKRRRKGRVVQTVTRVVLGTMAGVAAALARSTASRGINTSFVERQDAPDRHRKGRKAPKPYTTSKDWSVHGGMTDFTVYSDDFRCAVRTSREPIGEGRWRRRTPAMGAGLADRVRTIREWITMSAVQQRHDTAAATALSGRNPRLSRPTSRSKQKAIFS